MKPGNRKRALRLVSAFGVKSLPDFDKMSKEQFEAWTRESTDEELDLQHRHMLAKHRGCRPDEVEGILHLTMEELTELIARTEIEVAELRAEEAKNQN